MKTYIKIIFILSGIVTISLLNFSCSDKDDNNSGGSGTGIKAILVVQVNINNNPVQEGVAVVTNPTTTTVYTDAFGQAKFENIPVGIYDVYSYIPQTASGKTVTQVLVGVNDAEIDLIMGIYIEPDVRIHQPYHGQGFAVGDEIEFVGYANDNNTEATNLKVTWSSNIDGLLGTSQADSSGKVTFRTAGLSPAEHIIKLTATNDFNISMADSVWMNTLSPRAVTLSLQQDANYNVTLNWTTTKTDIDHFKIFRYTSDTPTPELLATLDNQQMSLYDNSVPFTDSAFYYVQCYNQEGYFSNSNVAGCSGTPYFEIKPQQAIYYPNTELLYVVVANRILVIDHKTNSILSDNTIVSNTGDICAANNGYGDELYVPCHDGWIYIYDLFSFEQKETINVGVPVECAVSDNNGLIFVSISPSPWWEQPLRVYHRTTLQYVDGNGDFDDCRLRLLPSNNEIIEITRSVGPVDMDYYKFDENGVCIQHEDDPYHGDHPLDANIYKVAPAQNYLVTSKQGAVYDADQTMVYRGMLPGNAAEFSDFEFSNDGSVIYAGSSIHRKILIYDYPSLANTGEIATKGFPIYLFRDNGKLIVISSPEAFSGYYGPESFGIEVHQMK